MSGTKKQAALSTRYVTAMRSYLRLRATAADGEIKDLIHAARDDLILGGVNPARANDEADALIKRAIGTYIKAEFGLDNADSEKYRAAFKDLKHRLLLSQKYTAQ